MELLAFFGPMAVTVALVPFFAVLQWWGRTRGWSPARRWVVLGSAVALAGYGAATVYGLAFIHPLDICASPTGDGVYMDLMRDYRLDHVTVDAFPPRVTCVWDGMASYGDPPELAASTWGRWLMYAGLAVAATGVVARARLNRGTPGGPGTRKNIA